MHEKAGRLKLPSARFGKGSLYALSLPERLVRSLSGILAGAVQEIGEVILPARVRRSRFYRAVAGATLRFLIVQVGEIEISSTELSAVSDSLVRRAAGSVVDLAGISLFHASPIWILAALSDLAGVGRETIGEIGAALEEAGLVERGGTPANVEELLRALERTAGSMVDAISMPPLNLTALREEWKRVSSEAKYIPQAALPSGAALRAQWEALQCEAARQGFSVVQVSSVMALSAVRALPESARWLSRALKVGGRRTGEVFAQQLLDHYWQTLDEIRRVGYLKYWTREFAPYLKGALRQLSLTHRSHTERLAERIRAFRHGE